jgi:hypothetical protein
VLLIYTVKSGKSLDSNRGKKTSTLASYTVIINFMLQNIHRSNDNVSFPFNVDVFFPLLLSRLLPDLTVYMSSTTVSSKMQELLTLREHPSLSPGALVR